MKKTHILFSLIFFCNFSFAQPYLPMLEEDHLWWVGYGCCDPIGCNFGAHDYQINGEVVFNGITYKTIDGCYYREENGFVYVFDDLNETEYVLFDFTLDVGDLYNLYYGSGNVCGLYEMTEIDTFEVTAVETQFLAGADRKVIYLLDTFSNSWEDIWIEGIGSLFNGPAIFYPNFHCGKQLRCFTKDGITYFFNNNDLCEPIIGIEEQRKNTIELYPNPVSDVSHLLIPAESDAHRLIIYDLSGRVFLDSPITTTEIPIHAQSFIEGLYIYQVFTENTTLKTGKFIVK